MALAYCRRSVDNEWAKGWKWQPRKYTRMYVCVGWACTDSFGAAYNQPTLMRLTLESCIESMIGIDDEPAVIVNASWVRYAVDWSMWGGSNDNLQCCINDVVAAVQSILELDGEYDKEVDTEHLRSVVDAVVDWIETEYSSVVIDHTE